MASSGKKKVNKELDMKDLAAKLSLTPKLVWDTLDASGRQKADQLAHRYIDFLSQAKTERAVVNRAADFLAANGFVEMKGTGKIKGSGWLNHHGKLIGVFVPGRQSPENGFNIIVAHGDSPRLDLKPKCVYEESTSGLGLLRTNLYGGLKKFQWLARPLALWGFCALADGRKVEIKFGEDPQDPVLTIADLLPHLDRKAQRDKKISEAIVADKMNLLAAGLPIGNPEDKDRLKLAILKILNDKWGLVEEDLISSEIEIVPAGPAREVGLDGSLIGGYGQDDRIAVFAGLEALSAVKKPDRPTLMVVYDREEIGSYGSAGASGNFLEHLATRAFQAVGLEPRWASVNRALLKSCALSADVEAGMDPDYREVHEELNSARIGRGPCLVRYTGGAGKYGASEAGAEYMAQVRAAFAADEIIWQSAICGKQEEGGGGTVALFLADYGLNVVDCGPPVLGMHSPFEVSSKADLAMTVKAYQAFLKMK